MIFFKDLQNSVHAIDSMEFVSFLPEGCVEISEDEAKILAAEWVKNNLPTNFI